MAEGGHSVCGRESDIVTCVRVAGDAWLRLHSHVSMSHCHMSAIKPHALAATAFLAAEKTPIRIKLVGLWGVGGSEAGRNRRGTTRRIRASDAAQKHDAECVLIID